MNTVRRLETDRRRLLPAAALASVLIGLALVAAPARATHEQDHRFTVTGRVFDAEGKPVRGARVAILDEAGQVMATGRTGVLGGYSILVHLHDPDYGRTLEVLAESGSAGVQRAPVRVSFERGNQTQTRGTRVNLGPVPERSGPPPAVIGGIVAAVLLVGAGLVMGRRRLQRAREARALAERRAKRAERRKNKRG